MSKIKETIEEVDNDLYLEHELHTVFESNCSSCFENQLDEQIELEYDFSLCCDSPIENGFCRECKEGVR